MGCRVNLLPGLAALAFLAPLPAYVPARPFLRAVALRELEAVAVLASCVVVVRAVAEAVQRLAARGVPVADLGSMRGGAGDLSLVCGVAERFAEVGYVR